MHKARFQDHFSGVSAEYRRFRPGYPEELFAWLANLAPSRECAWDCATGSGQAARLLTGHFHLVAATDASTNQLRQAETMPGLHYLTALAEATPFRSASIDLVTVAQALHWFDLERFYNEARRVLRPGGIIAAWTYNLLRIEPAINRAIKHLYVDILDSYWPQERRLVEANYRTIPFPFQEVAAPLFTMTVDWRLGDLLGYLSTWSAVQRYRQATGRDPLDQVRAELLDAWGEPDLVRHISWPLVLRVGVNRP